MNHLEQLGSRFSISIQPDEKGYLGRECPESQCEGYFKIVLGTGLKGITHCYCPYCGHKSEQSHFTTKDQIEYAKSVAIRKITEAITKDFKKMEFDHKPRGSFGIGMSLKVKEGPKRPLHYYCEKELETYIECSNCTLKYAVYGAFGFCPDCGQHNSFQIFKKSTEVVIKTLHLAEKTEESDITDRLIENALEDCVSTFDGFGREFCLVNSGKSKEPEKASRITFQNIESAAKKVNECFGYNIRGTCSILEWEEIIRGFQKRHLFSHKMGVIDDEYIAKAKDPTAIKGRKIAISIEEVRNLTILLQKVAEGIIKNIR